MRTQNGGETLTLQGTAYRVTPRVKVANGSGTMIDLTSYMESVGIDHDVDQPVGGATITFRRDASATLSLAPLRTDSTLNVNDAAAYSPLLDLNRSVTVEVATTRLGTSPSASRQNIALQSEVLGTTWTTVFVTIGTNATTAPDLTTTADKVQEDNTTNNHAVIQAITCAQVVQTFSIWVKAAERTKCVVSMGDGVTGNATIGVDLTNGTTFASGLGVGSWTAISSVVEPWPSGWYRVSVTATRGAGTQTTLQVYTYSTALNHLGITGNGVYAWGAQLELASAATDYIKTTTVAVTVNDYKLMFKGTIDVVNFERSPVSIICRDLGAPLVDRWIEAEATYGSGGGTAIQTVMQSILDDVFGGGVYTLYVPVSPGFNVITYRQQRMSVMDALQDLVQLIGWDVRFKWDDGTSAFRLTLTEPPRTKTVPDYTFAPSTYFDITQANLDITNIRNVVTGSYRNSANLGNRATVTVSDSASITKYGRRFFYIQEADVSPIDTAAEMTTMVTAALADLKDPKTEQEVDMPFFWPADISDLYRYSNNSVHFNTDQDIAVVELTHDLSMNHHRTRVKVRGTPIGQYATWLGRGGTMGGGGATGQAFAPYAFIAPRNTEASDATWDLRFNALNGSGGGGTNLTYTVKSKETFATEATISSGNASAFPLDLTITRNPKQDQVITFTVTDAATGLFASDKFTVPAFVPAINGAGNVVSNFVEVGTVSTRFRCKLFNVAAQTISNLTLTTLLFDSEVYDVGGLHSTATNTERITIPAGGDVGFWALTLQVAWVSNTAGYRIVRIYDSSGAILGTAEGPPANGTLTTQQVTVFVNAPAVGEYYRARVFQASGGNLDVNGAAGDTHFSAAHLW